MTAIHLPDFTADRYFGEGQVGLRSGQTVQRGLSQANRERPVELAVRSARAPLPELFTTRRAKRYPFHDVFLHCRLLTGHSRTVIRNLIWAKKFID